MLASRASIAATPPRTVPLFTKFVMAPFAAGLLIYWITSNILTIAQQKQQIAAAKATAQKQGLAGKVMDKAIAAGQKSYDGTQKSWANQVKKQGKPFTDQQAQESYLSGMQNSLNAMRAATNDKASPQQLYLALVGIWGAQKVSKVRAQLGL